MQVKKLLKFCSWNIEGLSGKLDDEDFLILLIALLFLRFGRTNISYMLG